MSECMKFTPKHFLLVALALVFITAVVSYDITFGGPAVIEGITTFNVTVTEDLKKGDSIDFGSVGKCNLFKDDADDEDFLSQKGEWCTLHGSNFPIAELEIADEAKEEDSCDELDKENNTYRSFTLKLSEDVKKDAIIVCKSKISKAVTVSGQSIAYRVNDNAVVITDASYPQFAKTTVDDIGFSEKDGEYTLSFKTNKVGPLKIVPSCADVDDEPCTLETDNIYCSDGAARLYTHSGKSYIYVLNPEKKISCSFNFWSVSRLGRDVHVLFDDVPGAATKSIKLQIPKEKDSYAVTQVRSIESIDFPYERIINIFLFTPSLTLTKGQSLHLRFSASNKDIEIKDFVDSLELAGGDFESKVLPTNDGFLLEYKGDKSPSSFETSVSYKMNIFTTQFPESDIKVKVTDVKDKTLSDIKNGFTIFLRAVFDVESFDATVVGSKKDQLKLVTKWKPLVADVTSKWFVLFRLDKNINKNSYDCDVEVENAKVKSKVEYYYGDLIVSSDEDVPKDQQVIVTCQIPFDAKIGKDKDIRVYSAGDIVGNIYSREQFSSQLANNRVIIKSEAKDEVTASAFDLFFGIRLDYDANKSKQGFFKKVVAFFKDEETVTDRINEKLDYFVKKLNTITGLSTIKRDSFAFLEFTLDGPEFFAPFATSKGSIREVTNVPVHLHLGLDMTLNDNQIKAIEGLFPKQDEFVVVDFNDNNAFVVDNIKTDEKIEKGCYGKSALGTPACSRQFPGGSCNHHAQCYQGACYDKKCQSMTTYAPYVNAVSPLATVLAVFLAVVAVVAVIA